MNTPLEAQKTFVMQEGHICKQPRLAVLNRKPCKQAHDLFIVHCWQESPGKAEQGAIWTEMKWGQYDLKPRVVLGCKKQQRHTNSSPAKPLFFCQRCQPKIAADTRTAKPTTLPTTLPACCYFSCRRPWQNTRHSSGPPFLCRQVLQYKSKTRVCAIQHSMKSVLLASRGLVKSSMLQVCNK